MSFDLSVPKITFIFYPTEEQVWEFWDVFLILLFFFWKEDEEQDLDWEAHPLRGHHLRGHPLRGFPFQIMISLHHLEEPVKKEIQRKLLLF